jgi:prepilin-type N-terminal cleavage/methylation domain-containing protein
MSRRDGFTLLEIVIALVIALMLTSLAVPGIMGLLRERDLQRTFESFDDMVRRAQERAVSEGRGFRIVFTETGAILEPSDPREEDAQAEVEQYAIGEDETLTLNRVAALAKQPPAEWPFWRSGCCEPVEVTYTGKAGSWTAEYDALTVRGKLVQTEVR